MLLILHDHLALFLNKSCRFPSAFLAKLVAFSNSDLSLIVKPQRWENFAHYSLPEFNKLLEAKKQNKLCVFTNYKWLICCLTSCHASELETNSCCFCSGFFRNIVLICSCSSTSLIVRQTGEHFSYNNRHWQLSNNLLTDWFKICFWEDNRLYAVSRHLKKEFNLRNTWVLKRYLTKTLVQLQ